MEQYKSLILRSSRQLGAELLKLGIIDKAQLDKAQQMLLQYIKEGNYKQACLLKFLTYELNAFDESVLLNQAKFPLIDLAHFDIPNPSSFNVEPDLCYATWTVPFSREENYYFVATTYGLAQPTIEYWEKTIPGNIIWHSTSLSSIIKALEDMTVAIEKDNQELKTV